MINDDRVRRHRRHREWLRRHRCYDCRPYCTNRDRSRTRTNCAKVCTCCDDFRWTMNRSVRVWCCYIRMSMTNDCSTMRAYIRRDVSTMTMTKAYSRVRVPYFRDDLHRCHSRVCNRCRYTTSRDVCPMCCRRMPCREDDMHRGMSDAMRRVRDHVRDDSAADEVHSMTNKDSPTLRTNTDHIPSTTDRMTNSTRDDNTSTSSTDNRNTGSRNMSSRDSSCSNPILCTDWCSDRYLPKRSRRAANSSSPSTAHRPKPSLRQDYGNARYDAYRRNYRSRMRCQVP